KTVNSEDFEIRLMMYLLLTLTNITIDKVYPDPSDISDSAMLARIKYIRNNVARTFGANLSGHRFNKYWDDIRQ
ncbi:Hypothetical predicted protein, partial [Mytilus galloprovincialis]